MSITAPDTRPGEGRVSSTSRYDEPVDRGVRWTPRQRISLALPIAAAAMLAGCGSTTEIDPPRPRAPFGDAVKVGGLTTAKSVSCPSGVKAKKGDTFTCDATLANGASGTVTVHITSGDGHIHIGSGDFHQTK